ncbi:MAG: hydrogenase maturation nickel metallochaperone HypA [Bacteroidales bacterium]|nr:hydrogenase maturation nickel metallochaperone HypA [Bacteroidales bacterium]
MHELGIVFYIIRDVKEAAEEHGVQHVNAVVMNIGEVSTVVPEYLTDCWRWAADKEELLKGCELRCNIIPAITVCNACSGEYATVEYGRTCPLCGSEDTVLKCGNEVEIKEIEV